jgi:hypothetical protein
MFQVPILLNSEFEEFAIKCRKIPKAYLYFMVAYCSQFIPLWIYTHTKRISQDDGSLRDDGTSSMTESAMNLMMAINIFPAIVVSLGFVFFYTSLLSLAICLVNHLDDVFNYLKSTDFDQQLRNPEGNNAQCLDASVRQVLKYAHQLHIRVIE